MLFSMSVWLLTSIPKPETSEPPGHISKMVLLVGFIPLGNILDYLQRVPMSELSVWNLARVLGTRDIDC